MKYTKIRLIEELNTNEYGGAFSPVGILPIDTELIVEKYDNLFMLPINGISVNIPSDKMVELAIDMEYMHILYDPNNGPVMSDANIDEFLNKAECKSKSRDIIYVGSELLITGLRSRIYKPQIHVDLFKGGIVYRQMIDNGKFICVQHEIVKNGRYTADPTYINPKSIQFKFDEFLDILLDF